MFSISKVPVISLPEINEESSVREGSIKTVYAHAQNEGPDQLTIGASLLKDPLRQKQPYYYYDMNGKLQIFNWFKSLLPGVEVVQAVGEYDIALIMEVVTLWDGNANKQANSEFNQSSKSFYFIASSFFLVNRKKSKRNEKPC